MDARRVRGFEPIRLFAGRGFEPSIDFLARYGHCRCAFSGAPAPMASTHAHCVDCGLYDNVATVVTGDETLRKMRDTIIVTRRGGA